MAFLLARLVAARRLGVPEQHARPWLSLSWLMAMIDDFGGVSLSDPLFQADGTAVCGF